VVFVFAVVTCVLIWRVSQRISDEMFSQLETRGKEMVTLLAEGCLRPLAAADLSFVETMASEAGKNESVIQASIITYVELYTSKAERDKGVTDVGTYVGHSDPSMIQKAYELPEGLNESDVGKEIVVLNLPDGSRRIRFRKPMIYTYKGKNRVIGAAEIIMDLSDITNALRKVRKDITFYCTLSAIVSIIGIILLFTFILRPVRMLVEAMSRISLGDFKLQVIARDPSEVGVLTRSFNAMAAELETLQAKAVAQELIKKELDIAETIQHGLLPETLPEIEGLDITARYESAEIVGGDYYDVFQIEDQLWAFTIGDVSGKGIPGSLVMSITRSVLRAHASSSRSPSEVLIKTNKILCEDIPAGLFVTLALAYYNQKNGTFSVASAGHNPVLLRRGEKIHQLKLSGIPLGADDSGIFDEVLEEGTLTLRPDDFIFMYTDGITEAMDHDKQLFGLERLKEAISSYRDGPLKNFPVTLMRRLQDFRDGAKPNDDLTFIAIRRHS
ncbi:PP2C family protein-serine/threonine phosphatase, partial [Calditrichota bacterium]